jgi:hypothetical protein
LLRLFRDSTVAVPGWDWVKDLSRLGRNLANVVIVDDNSLMFQAQPCNAIWVEAFDPLHPSDDVLNQVLGLLLLQVLPALDVTECLGLLVGLRITPCEHPVDEADSATVEQDNWESCLVAFSAVEWPENTDPELAEIFPDDLPPKKLPKAPSSLKRRRSRDGIHCGITPIVFHIPAGV